MTRQVSKILFSELNLLCFQKNLMNHWILMKISEVFFELTCMAVNISYTQFKIVLMVMAIDFKKRRKSLMFSLIFELCDILS